MIDDKEKPYIGVTGFKTIEEIQAIRNFLEEQQPLEKISYQMIFGIICSDKRLENPSSSGKNSPPVKEIKYLIEEVLESPGILPVIHYTTSAPDGLYNQINDLLKQYKLIQYGKRLGLHINLPWANPQHITQLKNDYPSVDMIVQIPPQSITAGLSNTDIVKKCCEYQKIEYLILDAADYNNGTDTNYISTLCKDLIKQLINTRVGIVGNFNEANIGANILVLASIVGEPFCIDASNKLYTGNQLDIPRTIQYILNAVLNLSRINWDEFRQVYPE